MGSTVDTPGSEATFDNFSLVSHGDAIAQHKLRVVVVFGNTFFAGEKRIIVPVTPSIRVSDFLAEAVRRAQTLGLQLSSTADLVVHTENEHGPIAFGEDTLRDILDPMENMVWIQYADAAESQKDLIYVRWITAGRALDHRTISSIPTDPTPIHKLTTVADVKSIAVERIYKSGAWYEASGTPSNFSLELFLATCHLSTTDEQHTSLSDLGCSGSVLDPLNIFVVPRHTTPAALFEAPVAGTQGKKESKEQLHDLWGFNSSDRGKATFQTCLAVLMGGLRGWPKQLRSYLQALFRLTHFPPAIEALQTLATENKLVPMAVLVLATCFRELALRMIPGSVTSGGIESALEGSRQIFAWLESESIIDFNGADDPEASLSRYVKFEEVSGKVEQGYNPAERFELVEFLAAGEPTRQSSVTPESTVQAPPPQVRFLRQVRVRTYITGKEDLKILAIAAWGNYETVNHYVDFRGNINEPWNHLLSPSIDPIDFKRLLLEANSSKIFRMISPAKLSISHSSCVTLSSEGFVSQFTTVPGQFKNIQSSLKNAITGSKILKGDNPGKAIAEALQPIIQSRLAEKTWEIDDWNIGVGSAEEARIPSEAIVVCFDTSLSMDEPLGQGWTEDENTLSRLDETKQVFRNFIARMVGYQLVDTHVGLVTFSGQDEVDVAAELSEIRQTFKNELEDVGTDGLTAIWDALMVAGDMLISLKLQYPETKLRIVVLTDGDDNNSLYTPGEVCKYLYDFDVVVDSLVIGTDATDDLFTISKHTGGYAFCPTSRLLLFQTFLLEPFLSLSLRPDIVRVPIEDEEDYDDSQPKEPDMKTVYDFPPCRPHVLESGDFISLSNASLFFLQRPASSYGPSILAAIHGRGATGNGGALISSRSTDYSVPVSTRSTRSERATVSSGKLYLDEMRLIVASPHPAMDVYVNESDTSFWKIVMQGAASSPYENGTFVLYVHMTESYPQGAPVVRFITPILHPNITKHGRICHGILSDGWAPTMHIHEVMEHIYDLLSNPVTDDAVDELATLKFWTDRDAANIEISKYVDKFAKRTRDELRTEIVRQ